MSDVSTTPDIGTLEIPKDQWTEPFWQANAREVLMLPRCGACGTFRWPPGPFCARCQSQAVVWAPAGPASLYSYTIVRQRDTASEGLGRLIVPGLVEFADAGGVRIMAPIIGATRETLKVDAALELGWIDHGDDKLPVFSLAAA